MLGASLIANSGLTVIALLGYIPWMMTLWMGQPRLNMRHWLVLVLGVPVIAIPKTMDNDVHGTDYCIGFSTAVTRGVEFIHKLRTMGEREVPSRLIGELVMEELRALDEVAYVRFASVYRQFQDITEFEDEIRRLQRISETAASREQMSLLPELLGKKKT